MEEEDLAERYRLEGNEHFRSSRYHNAIKNYTKSLECRETSAVLSNRAQAYLNTKQYERALMDSAKAFELDSTNTKAIFRYAKALANLQLYEVAADKLKKTDQLEPNNKEIAKLRESIKDKANCSELKFCCGDKDEFLRSKLPLKEIKNIEKVGEQSPKEVEEEEKSMISLSRESTSELEIPPPPTTSFKLISDFHALKNNPAAFVTYFWALDKEKYGELFGEVIETEMIETLIMGFDSLIDQFNINDIAECLIHLAQVPRFDIAATFLEERSKKVLRELLERCELDQNQLSLIKMLYAL